MGFSPRARSEVAVSSPVVDCHLLALTFYNILNHRIDIFFAPEVFGTTVAGPPSATSGVNSTPGKPPAGLCLQRSQNWLRFSLSLNDDVNMVASDVSCKYPPLVIKTGLRQSLQHNLAALLIQPVGFLF